MKATILIDNNTKDSLVPEWGLSVWIEQDGHRILLDTGSSETFAKNADALGISLDQADCGVLSHAHYDHSDGLAAFFERNDHAPFYLRKGAGENCYRKKNKIFYHYIGIHKGYLKEFASRIRYADGDVELFPGITLLPHKTPGLEEAGRRAKMYVRRGFRWIPDDFSHEQSLVVDTRDGLVVFNSCSHGGADTIIRETEAAWPGKRIAALIGGLHLFRSSDEMVRALAKRVRETEIGSIYTGHCTGERAMAILQEELGDRVQSLYTGMEITIG